MRLCSNVLRANRTARGFSLMELMVVIAILGILTTLVVTNVIPALQKSKVTAAQHGVKTIKDAILLYRNNNNKIPDNLDVLTQPDPKYFDEPYLEGSSLLDPWDNAYVLVKEGGSKFEVLSYGADGMPQGEGEDADISSKDISKAGT